MSQNKTMLLLTIFTLICVSTTATELKDYSPEPDLGTPQIRHSDLRTEYCLNGYWRFYPLSDNLTADVAPASGSGWGYLKVPGVWPQSDGKTHSIQPLVAPEQMKNASKWHSAWYSREIDLPDIAKDSQVFLDIEHIQTRGTVYLDGQKAGEIVFPGGMTELTALVKSGTKQNLLIKVSAVPLSEEHYEIMDGDNIRKVAAKVPNKGIVGDVFLRVVPVERIAASQYIAKVRDGKVLTIAAEPVGLLPEQKYSITATIFDRNNTAVKTFTSPHFTTVDLVYADFPIADTIATDWSAPRLIFSADWPEAELWDLHTPENLYHAQLTLKRAGQTVDITLPERFGFREFTIDGQNYLLNDTVIHLRAYHLPNYSAFWMADKASKEVSTEAFRRLRELGFNFTISRNYNFREGQTNYLRGHCEAADEFGHLHSMSLPHPTQFAASYAKQPEKLLDYERMAGYLIRKYWNHPSLILWVANHNHSGAWGDQNPQRIGGDYVPANSAGERENKEKGRYNFLQVQKVVTAIDVSRPIYSHASGSLGGQYSLNAYFNWSPIQERSDWLELFSQQGKYPLSFMEWGLPHIASFSSHRWPDFIWGATSLQTSWDAEYAAALFGDSVAEWTAERISILDQLIKFADKPFQWGKISGKVQRLPDVLKVQATYFQDNLPAMRAWNIGILLPWDEHAFYQAVPGAPGHKAKENPQRREKLNQPGIVPDFYNWGDYILTAHPENTQLSVLGEVVKVWNQPRIAWIGGADPFTTKEHNYRPGDTVTKTLVILNDTRVSTDCSYQVQIEQLDDNVITGMITIAAGAKATIPVRLSLPEAVTPGEQIITAKFTFTDNLVLDHNITINIVPPLINQPPTTAVESADNLYLFDPVGLTSQEFDRIGISYNLVTIDKLPTAPATLVIGRQALNDALPLNLDAVTMGLKVLILEQDTAIIKRLGFRYQEYGLRQIFLRQGQHPVFAGLTEDLLHDWSGEATLLPPYINYRQFFVPEWDWCGFKNTRVWRCRNRGVVANVLIEKPTLGNFSPLTDGGFALQYAPILEYTEGKGRIVFCQAEVTGRTVPEPASEMLLTNLVNYVSKANEPVYQSFAILGSDNCARWLYSLSLTGQVEPEDAQVLLVSSGLESYPDLSKEAASGKTVIVLGWNAETINKYFPDIAATEVKAATSTLLPRSDSKLLAGINNLDASFQTKLDYTQIDNYEIAVKSIGQGQVVFVGVTADRLDYAKEFRLRSSYRRRVFLLTQILRNANISLNSPLLERFKSEPKKQPWLDSYYLQTPITGDDPYRYYHW